LPEVRKSLPPADGGASADALSEVLRTVRLTGATFFSAEFRAPWGFTSPRLDRLIHDGDGRLVLFHLVLDGHANARVERAEAVALNAGDVVAFPHGHSHRVWQGRPARWYDTLPAATRALAGDLQVTRTGGAGELTRFVCGYFSCEPWVVDEVLGGLPSMLTVGLRDGERRSWIEDAILFLAAEAASDHAGRTALLTMLSEALFVETLRRWMTAMPAAQVGWLAGARDGVVGRALALLHREPSRRWTLETLARGARASRTTLADRFMYFLGESPMTYLARWRLELGARLLQTRRHSVLEVAGQVGYESEAAFNRAFKRQFGLPPGRYRLAHASRQPVSTSIGAARRPGR